MDGRTDGRTDGCARTREEDRPHQGRRKRNRHGGSFKSHAGKRFAEEASRGDSQQTVRPAALQGLISIYANDPSMAPSPDPPPDSRRQGLAYFVSSSMRLVSTGASFSGTEHRAAGHPGVRDRDG